MSFIPKTKTWKEFFELYGTLPSLWCSTDDDYKNRSKKNQDWETLLEKYKEIDPKANIQSLKSKLHNVRFCYRRELRKSLTKSESSQYVSNLWYFDLLDFLRYQESSSSKITPLDVTEEALAEEEMDIFTPKPPPAKKRKVETNYDHVTEKAAILKGVLDILQKDDKERDDADIFAANWAVQFRKISPNQQIYAKKAIEDILFLGLLDQLAFDTVPMPQTEGIEYELA